MENIIQMLEVEEIKGERINKHDARGPNIRGRKQSIQKCNKNRDETSDEKDSGWEYHRK